MELTEIEKRLKVKKPEFDNFYLIKGTGPYVYYDIFSAPYSTGKEFLERIQNLLKNAGVGNNYILQMTVKPLERQEIAVLKHYALPRSNGHRVAQYLAKYSGRAKMEDFKYQLL